MLFFCYVIEGLLGPMLTDWLLKWRLNVDLVALDYFPHNMMHEAPVVGLCRMFLNCGLNRIETILEQLPKKLVADVHLTLFQHSLFEVPLQD